MLGKANVSVSAMEFSTPHGALITLDHAKRSIERRVIVLTKFTLEE